MDKHLDELLHRVECNDQTLTTVNLGGYGYDITDRYAQFLAKALCTNDSVTRLYLDHIGLSDVSVSALIRMLRRNHSLTTVDLLGNHFHPHSVAALVDALARNRRVTQFLLDPKKLTVEAWEKKHAILIRNRKLVVFRVLCCKKAMVTLLGIRKLKQREAGLLRPMPRDVLKMITQRLYFTRQRLEWDRPLFNP